MARAPLTYLAFAAVAAAGPVDKAALAADDACGADASCAFHALQQQRWEVDGHGATELRASEPVSEHEALFQAMAQAGIKERHLEQPRKEYSALSLKEALAKSNATTNSSCDTWTGGTCTFSGCGESRGAATCSSFRCMCQQGFCAQNGRCVFDFGSAMSSFGHWGAPPAPRPAPYFSWGGPAPAPAPAPMFSWGGGPSLGSSPWASAWSSGGPVTSGSALTGGSCVTSACDASRGATDCGFSTGYQCKCKNGFYARNGVCVWR